MPGVTETGEGWPLAIVGLLLLAGHAAHMVGARVHVPRVTLLLLLGVVCGPAALDIVPPEIRDWFPLVAHMALAMVGFLLGERFLGKDLRRSSRIVLSTSLCETVLAAVLVFVALVVAGAPAPFAFVLAGIACATAPAATLDVVQEGGGKGPLTETMLRVVAIDDAWGIILFSLLLVGAEAASGAPGNGQAVLRGLWEIAGAVVLGVVVGAPMAALTGKLRPGEPTLVEAAGFVFLCAGLATVIEVSYLLACMVLGAFVANRADHYERPFHAIQHASAPFLALFFVLSGVRFDPEVLWDLGLFGAIYVLARSAGKVIGGTLGARLGGAPPVVTRRIGWCLLPQAGVALGLALLAANRLPEIGTSVLSVVIAATVMFEIFGPIATRRQLHEAGEL